MDLVGRQLGNYVAKKQLGRGGMGTVYMAEHPLIGRKVAVKVLHEELAIDEGMVQRLWLEAKSASEIDSEHIVEVLDFGKLPLGTSAGEKRETVYLAMELLEGKSLADKFFEEGMSFRDSVDVAVQVCRALHASHAKGIVHRDLKPENVFLTNRGGRYNFVKILDFGIAKLVSNPYGRTRTGVLLGTPAYMSPEQCRGSGEVDGRSDIYSLGIMLYELVAGTVPFAALGFGDVLVSQMMTKPEPPSTHNPQIPKSLEAAILCALEKKAADRFQSMAAFGQALATIGNELDEIAEQHHKVQAFGPRDKTTDRDAPGKYGANEGATLVDPPAAGLAALPAGATRTAASPAAAQGNLHERATQALADPSLHQKETMALGRGGLHQQQTLIKPQAGGTSGPSNTTVLAEPQGQHPVAAPMPVVPKSAPDAQTMAQVAPPEAKQRVAGASLQDVLGSTGAVRELEAALDRRGAPPPVAPNLPTGRIAPGSSSAPEADAYLAEEQKRFRIRMIIVGCVLLVAAVTILLAVR